MLIALLSTLIILCAILLISFLWERRKCLRMQKRLFRESRKLEHTNHVASAILKNVHAFILLINNDFKVLKTNYYQQTGTRKGPEEKRVGDLLQCCNALSAEVNPEKPDVPLNKNDAFQKVQKRRVQEKR